MEDTIRLFPDMYIYKNMKIWELTQAALGKWSNIDGSLRKHSAKPLVDSRERCLIALFDKKTLLNRQTGGKYGSFEPDAEIATMYTKMRIRLLTDLWESYERAAPSAHSTEPSSMFLQVTAWVKKVHKFGRDNPGLTMYGEFGWKDDHEENIARQACGTIVNNILPFVVIGKDITITDITNSGIFLKGECVAGQLTKLLLKSLHKLEHDFTESFEIPSFDLLIPFIDLFPFIGQEPENTFAGFVDEYLSITNPIMVITFSARVAAAVTKSKPK